MVMRKTPFLRLRYPWGSDVATAADVDATASDIDQALVTTSRMSTDFSRMASVVAQRLAAVSLVKGNLTAVSFDTITLNNGANSPLSNAGWWSAANPTRLTAPVPCVVLACGSGGVNLGAALGASGVIQVTVRKNGSINQGTKFSPISTISGQQWGAAMTMWSLAAGDYIELLLYWTGTPAGPYNSDTVVPPMLSLMMVSLPSPA